MPGSPPAIPEFALARSPSSSYERCVRTGDEPIDLELARAQHDGYVDVLRRLGVEVEVLGPVDAFPDAVFVEDVAVLLEDCALLARPGIDSRQGEVAWIEDALSRHFHLARIEAPGCLDGGDVMRAGSRIFVGASSRTNRQGINALSVTARELGLDVVEVQLAEGLHLKSACTVLDARTLVYLPGSFDVRPFQQLGFEFIEAREPQGANILAFGWDVVVSAAAPETAALLERRGYRIHTVDVGEFHKGDGALTCLSLRRAPFGAWTT